MRSVSRLRSPRSPDEGVFMFPTERAFPPSMAVTKRNPGQNSVRISTSSGGFHHNTGFTLIELVTVIVLLSIVAVIGTSFIVQSADSYHDSVSRSQLIQQGRQAIERITRELRNAVPNSVRVSSNHQCIEWLPSLGGGSYLEAVPDASNLAPPSASIPTGPLDLAPGTARFVTVGALADSELYGNSPASLERFSSISNSPSSVVLATSKRFLRNSVNQRLFIAENPKQFCVSGGALTLHENYISSAAYPPATITGTPPNTGVLMAEGVLPVVEQPFTVASGTQVRNALVLLELPFEKNGERVVLRHQVMVRNVP